MNIELAHPVSKLALRPHDNKWLENFLFVYERLSVDNLGLLSNVYHQDIIFSDPMHKVEGLDNLKDYFDNLYQNLNSCVFRIDNVIAQLDQAAVYWQMTYQHDKLNNGNLVKVYGHSHIKGDGDKVFYHRDYLDIGAMLYEQLPFFGRLVKWIKSRAVQ
jgi:hypothetical protein